MAFSPETFALLAGKSGGGSFPTPTAADVGSALTVVKKATPTFGSFIVPEQTVTEHYDEEAGEYIPVSTLSDVDLIPFTPGSKVLITLTIDGESISSIQTAQEVEGTVGVQWFYPDADTVSAYFVFFHKEDYTEVFLQLEATVDITFTLSIQAVTYSYSYEYGLDPYPGFDLVISCGDNRLAYDSTYELVKGSYEDARAKITAGKAVTALVFNSAPEQNNPDLWNTETVLTNISMSDYNESGLCINLIHPSGTQSASGILRAITNKSDAIKLILNADNTVVVDNGWL